MFSKFHKIFACFTEAEREIFQGTAIIFLLSLFLNGANAFYKGTTVAPVGGGTYTEGVVGQPITINPLLTGGNEPDRDLTELLFADLARLVQTIKSTDGGRLWNVSLKPDLHWSDGTPITSDDIIFTLTAIQDPETHSSLFGTWHGVTVERLGEREVRFTLKTPYAFFKDNLSAFKIVPAHLFDAVPPQNLRLSDFNLEPVGSGPYAFAGFEKRKDGFFTSYHLVANPSFNGAEPLIREFIFRFFQNYEEAIAAFNRHEVDGIGGLSPTNLAEIKIADQLHEIKIPRYYAIFMNQSAAAPLKDRVIRTALASATDRATMITRALGGRGIPIIGPLYPGIEGYDPTLTPPSFSIDEAIKLLDANGWLPGDDGIRVKKVGADHLRLAFELVVPDIEFLVESAKVIVDDWKKLGIAVTPLITNPADVTSDAVKSRNYQLLLFGNVMRENPDIFSFWHSSERFYPGLNLSLYENKVVDRLLETVRQEPDPVARRSSLTKLQKLITDDIPAIFLFSPNYLYAAPKNLGGFTDDLITTPANRFENITSWYLKTARIFK